MPAAGQPPGPAGAHPGPQRPSQVSPGGGQPPPGPQLPAAAGAKPGAGPRRRNRQGRSCSVGSHLWSRGHMPGTSAPRCPLCRGRRLCAGHSWARWSPVGRRHKLSGRERLRAGCGQCPPLPRVPKRRKKPKGGDGPVRVACTPALGQAAVQNCHGTATTLAREALGVAALGQEDSTDAGAL